MTTGNIVGFALFAVGMGLFGFAWHSTSAPIEQLSNSLTGRYRDETMWYFGIGVAAIVAGALLTFRGNRQ